MRRAILVLSLILAPLWASAQEAETPDLAIQGVISDQFSAFSTGNVFTAWTYASPTIQSIFQNPQYFGAMVERGFPMVWDPGEVTFQGLEVRNGRPVQRVQVIDQAGNAHLLDYEMVMVEGDWRISAVEIVEAPGVGV